MQTIYNKHAEELQNGRNQDKLKEVNLIPAQQSGEYTKWITEAKTQLCYVKREERR